MHERMRSSTTPTPRLLQRLSAWYGKLLTGLALVACAVLFLMMLMITADVLLRNVPIVPGLRGLRWSNDVSELMLFLIAMLVAPWLMRRGQHIRIDIVLFLLPYRMGWFLEWVCDVLAFIGCVTVVVLSTKATVASITSGSLSVKTIVMPEWWLIAPLPFAFALLAIETLFRMYRLYRAPRVPRKDAVTAG